MKLKKKMNYWKVKLKKDKKKQVNLYQPVNPVIGVMRSRQPYKKTNKKIMKPNYKNIQLKTNLEK
jgi:hypothetical protein